MPNSAWADRNLAEATGQLGKMGGIPESKATQYRSASTWDSLYIQQVASSALAPATQNQNALFKGLGLDEPDEKFRFVLYMPHLTPIRDPVVGEWCRTRYLGGNSID